MIKPGDDVTMTFQLLDETGKVWDDATKEEPFTYRHGENKLMSSVESAITGKKVGDTFAVSIPPEQGYGLVQENLKKTLPRDHFKDIQNLKVGMTFTLSEDAHISFSVTDIDEAQVHVDANHPLAGKTLSFEIEILSVQSQ